MRSHPSPSRLAFTLVELLVVIGIIAVLVGILLPTLSRARESANRVACASNLRQLAIGMILYANANRYALPATAYGNIPRRNETANRTGADWIWWDRRDYLDGSALAPFIGKPNLNLAVCDAALQPGLYPRSASTMNPGVFRCPSDDWAVRYRNLGAPSGPYPYSYVMSKYLGVTHLSEPPVSDFWKIYVAQKLTQVISSSEKVMLYEADAGTLNDGQGHPGVGDGSDSYDLLSIRHSRIKTLTHNTLGFTPANMPDPGEQGNVAYCDGSVRLTERRALARTRTYLPRWPVTKWPGE